MTKRRVVITGQGSINALGHTAKETSAAMAKGTCGIGPLDIPDIDRLMIKIGAMVKNYDPKDHFTAKQLSLLDRFSQFTLISAREAFEMSGLVMNDDLAMRTGVIMGNSGGGLATSDESYRAVYQDGKNRVHPFVVPRLMNNAAVSHISMAFGLRGPCFTVSTACASSNHAMGQAFHLIRGGMSDVVLTGGAEAMLCFGGLKAWEGLRVMSGDGCRPFCATRNGMVQGEGAAVFVFEDRDHALARGAEILAEIVGFGMTSDASDIVLPNQTGAENAMQAALDDAKITPAQIGYINAHGTGTMANDKIETAAIKSVYGAQAKQLLVSSTKSMHGHLIGATGAVEMLACVMVLKDGLIPPTIGYQQQDQSCDLNYVPNTAIHQNIEYAMSNSFAFGGLNAVLIVKTP